MTHPTFDRRLTPLEPIFNDRRRTGAVDVGNSPPPTSYPEEVLLDLPAYYLRLQELSGTVALDQGTSPSNGVYVGSPTLGQPGAYAGALSCLFDGVDDEVNRVSVPGPSRPFSMECWVKADLANQSPPGASVSLFGTRVTAGGYAMAVSNTGVVTLVTYSNGTANTAAPVMLSDVWTHIAGTCSASGVVRIYVDGASQSVAGSSTGIGASSAQIRVGALYGSAGVGTGARLVGSLSDIAYYQSELSAARVAAHYAAARV